MTNGKRGAQPNNTNALKHGLYARRFTKTEKKDLKEMPTNSLEHEINMLRVVTDRILQTLDAQREDIDAYTKLANSLTAAVTTLNTTMRTHALLTGAYTPLHDALLEALQEIDSDNDDTRTD